jgi:hypothetical protein
LRPLERESPLVAHTQTESFFREIESCEKKSKVAKKVEKPPFVKKHLLMLSFLVKALINSNSFFSKEKLIRDRP